VIYSAGGFFFPMLLHLSIHVNGVSWIFFLFSKRGEGEEASAWSYHLLRCTFLETGGDVSKTLEERKKKEEPWKEKMEEREREREKERGKKEFEK
jgi:hypothetical protein